MPERMSTVSRAVSEPTKPNNHLSASFKPDHRLGGHHKSIFCRNHLFSIWFNDNESDPEPGRSHQKQGGDIKRSSDECDRNLLLFEKAVYRSKDCPYLPATYCTAGPGDLRAWLNRAAYVCRCRVSVFHRSHVTARPTRTGAKGGTDSGLIRGVSPLRWMSWSDHVVRH